jgi:hypothetical protein
MNEFKINFLHVCENAFFSDDKKLNIIGIFEIINAPGFPAIHPRFSIVLNFSGDIAKSTPFFIILSPDGSKELVKVQINKNTFPNQDLKKNNNLILNFMGFSFQTSGKYRLILKVDDQIISAERDDIITVSGPNSE